MLKPSEVKKSILEIAYQANKGHIGSALSISDIIVSIFNFMISHNNFDEKNYSVTLSKGHAALALYCCLEKLNLISHQNLLNYEKDDTILGTHPDPELPWVNFLGGSLGQGLSFACGLALSDLKKNSEKKHFVILSDSELNSGVTWEIAALAGTNKINNLIVILDNNNQQALDLTKNVINYQDIESTFKSFGWETLRVDGHDQNQICLSLLGELNKPRFIIADTEFGAGISFMRGRIEWHYLPLTKELFEIALSEVKDK